MNRLAAEDAGHWLDAGTEHPHRIALSIRADHVAASVRQLGLGFQDSSLEVVRSLSLQTSPLLRMPTRLDH